MLWRGLEKELGKEWNMGQAGNTGGGLFSVEAHVQA